MAQARDVINNLKTMVSEKLYGFKNKTLALANSTLGKIDKWQGQAMGKLKGLVNKMKKVHEFLECICEIPTSMLNLRDILGKWGPLVDIMEELFPALVSKLKGIIHTFETPMRHTMKIVEKVRDVVGTLTKTAEQATDLDSIKATLVKLLKGVYVNSE